MRKCLGLLHRYSSLPPACFFKTSRSIGPVPWLQHPSRPPHRHPGRPCPGSSQPQFLESHVVLSYSSDAPSLLFSNVLERSYFARSLRLYMNASKFMAAAPKQQTILQWRSVYCPPLHILTSAGFYALPVHRRAGSDPIDVDIPSSSPSYPHISPFRPQVALTQIFKAHDTSPTPLC